MTKNITSGMTVELMCMDVTSMVIGAENTVCSVNDATWRVVAQRLISHRVPNTLSSRQREG